MADTAGVAGIVSIEGTPSERQVIVIKDDPTGRQVIAESTSGPDGSFSIQYSGWDGAVIVLALDTYGNDWSSNSNLEVGTIVHPTFPNGYVYEASNTGVTGFEEPTWSIDGDSSVTDGTITWNPKPFYRPIASGPIKSHIFDVAPVPNFRYVKIYILANDGGTYHSISELEIASEISGPDVTAPGMPATSTNPYSASYDADKAIDNNEANLYLSKPVSSFPETSITLDLLTKHDLVELRIRPPATSGHINRCPKHFVISGSDDNENWTPIIEFTDVTDYVTGAYRVFPLVN